MQHQPLLLSAAAVDGQLMDKTAAVRFPNVPGPDRPPHLGLQIVAAIKAGDEQQRVELKSLCKLLEPFRSAVVEGHAGVLITHPG